MVRMVASGAAAPTAWPRNGADASYPWSFSGRFWFRPALVRAPPEDALPDGVSAVAALGWTLGGVVTLEYDESPVGAYREYVTMGALVTKRGAVGQWGSRLCVSTPTAEAVCREVWGVPAQLADIELCEDLTGRGHTTRSVGDVDRISVQIPLADQTPGGGLGV